MKRATTIAPLLLVVAALGFVTAGCGSEHAVSLGPPSAQSPSNEAASGSATTGTAGTPATRTFEVWFARGEQLVPGMRTHAPTLRVATAAMHALLAGPTNAERAAGLTTAIPTGTRLLGISIADSVATVDLTSEYQSGGGSLSMQVRLGQVVYTLTQFPSVRTVRFSLDSTPVDVFSSEGIVLDHPVGRSDYKNLLVGSTTPLGPTLAGSWRGLPHAPITVDAESATGVWTGSELLVFGRVTKQAKDGAVLQRRNVAAAYNPATNSWRRLTPPSETGSFMTYSSAWTGREMLVWGQGTRLAFDPATNQWRRLPGSRVLSVHDGFGLVAWTGRELIGWGGGCCGDAFDDGVAFNPATNSWHALAKSPLAGSQHPIGAWTGRELIVLVGNFNPDGKPWPARLARAAAYDPATDTWRRIAPLPSPRSGATAVWDGRELLVVGGTGARPPALATSGFAYNPATNRWRRLPPMESGRDRAAMVWTGSRLLVWGGAQTAGAGTPVIPPHGLTYDPRANAWSPLPQAPLLGRLSPIAVWTGRSMIVWGGERPNAPGTNGLLRVSDGAAFSPQR